MYVVTVELRDSVSPQAANAVAVGKTRAREQSLHCGSYSGEPSSQSGRSVLCLQIHGDAAFTGQVREKSLIQHIFVCMHVCT